MAMSWNEFASYQIYAVTVMKFNPKITKTVTFRQLNGLFSPGRSSLAPRNAAYFKVVTHIFMVNEFDNLNFELFFEK